VASTTSISILRVATLVLLATSSGCAESDECGAYELEGADGCECIDGYTRQQSSGYCIATNLTLPKSQLPKQTGVDTPCTSDADCQGFDASFCETEVSGTCLVPRCDTDDPKACSVGHHCCAFGGLPNLCVSGELSAGVCH
jgi:hypothetical protein